MSTLPNYEDAIEIMSMPLLGTLVETGQYVCSYWEWSLTAATAASSDVELKFVQPFRMGMGAWVAQGTVASVPSGAFALQGVAWKLSTPWNWLPVLTRLRTHGARELLAGFELRGSKRVD